MTAGVVRYLAASGLLILAPLVSATTVSLMSTPASSSTFGERVTLTANVSSGAGKVTFYDGVTILGIDTLSAGTATIKTILLTPGTHSLTAQYDAATPIVSPPLSFTVTAKPGSALSLSNVLTAGTNPFSVVVDDFNRDGKADLAVANHGDGSVNIFLGDGTGGFTLTSSPYAVGGNPTSIVTGYFHGNRKVDLVVTDVTNNAVWILTGNGDGTFQAPVMIATTSSPYALAVSDFNGDGNSDIAVVNNTANTVTVFLGNGDGTFVSSATMLVGSFPRAIAVGDVNGDGIPDLVVANPYSMNIIVLIGVGNGTFDLAVPYSGGAFQNPSGIALGNFVTAGPVNIAASSTLTSDVSVLLNSMGSFPTATLYPAGGNNAFALAIGDFNGDTKLDLAVVNAYSNNVSILTGNGDGTFQPPVDFPAGSLPISLAVADFNSDGIADVAVANENDGIYILLGQGYTIALDGIGSESAPVNTLFGSPLQVLVKKGAVAAPGVAVTFTAPVSGPGAAFSGSSSTTVLTGGLGQASSGLPTANAIAGGPYVVTAQVGYGPPVEFMLTNTPVPTITAIAGTPQSATVNTGFTTALKVQVANSLGNPAGAGVPVTFKAPASGASGTFVGGSTVMTLADGTASVNFMANKIAGSYTVTATVPGVQTPASFLLTNTAGLPYSIKATSGSGQSASINVAFAKPLVATVKDQYGNPVPNTTVTFTPPVSGASGAFATTNTVMTNASGVATSTVFTADGSTGTYLVGASAPPASTTFSLTNIGGIILPAGVTVTPGQSVTFPVTLGTAAPTGVTITLKSSDTTKATVSLASVYIPAGATVSTLAKVTGVNYGTVIITASATGYMSVSQSINVVGSLSFSPTMLAITGTATNSLTLTLNTLAPAGGVTINLSSSTSSASVPATVKIAAYTKSVSVPVTGVTPGPAIIHASLLPYIPDTTASVTVSP